MERGIEPAKLGSQPSPLARATPPKRRRARVAAGRSGALEDDVSHLRSADERCRVARPVDCQRAWPLSRLRGGRRRTSPVRRALLLGRARALRTNSRSRAIRRWIASVPLRACWRAALIRRELRPEMSKAAEVATWAASARNQPEKPPIRDPPDECCRLCGGGTAPHIPSPIAASLW